MEWDFETFPMIEGSRTNSCIKRIYNYLNIGTWWGFGHEWNGILKPFP